MKTLNILTDSELKQLFGPLEDILPLHEGEGTVTSGKRKGSDCSATCLTTGNRRVDDGEKKYFLREMTSSRVNVTAIIVFVRGERFVPLRSILAYTTDVHVQLHLRRVRTWTLGVVVEDSSSMMLVRF